MTSVRIISAWRWCDVGDTAHNASSSPPSRRDRTLAALGDLDHLISRADKASQRDCPLCDNTGHARVPLMTVPVIVVMKSEFRSIPVRNNVSLTAVLKPGTSSGSEDQILHVNVS